VKQLNEIPIFSDLAEEQLRQIETCTTDRLYRKGMIIFMEGQPGEGFHYIQQGRVKIVKISDDGREHIIHLLDEGDIFAGVVLFNTAPYPATAVALEDCRIGVIKNSDLEQLALHNNALAMHLIKAINQRLLYAQQKIANLALHDVTARTAEVLLRLGKEKGRRNANGQIIIEMTLSRQDLASLVGTTRETVTRTLSSLKKSKVIDFDSGSMVILDEAALTEYLP
jgi:CRP/FNR family cyclic AMP-dependent transcriptional regulator